MEGNNPAPAAPASPQYSPETQALMTSKKWNTVDDMAKSYVELEKFRGVPAERLLTLPADEKDEKGWDAIYNRLGRPETFDKYEYKNESGIELDAESFKGFQKLAHKAGMTNKQFKQAMDAHLNVFKSIVQKQKEADDKAIEDCRKALSEKWKADLQKNSDIALEVANKLGIKDLLEKKGLGSDPEIIEKLFNIKSMMSESTLPKGGGTNEKSNEQRIAEITKSKEFTDAAHPDHMKVMGEYWRLNGINVTVQG